MDTSKYYFSSEGCSSSESGWTKYMDSPIQEDDAECSNVDDDGDGDDDGNSNSNKNDRIKDDDGDAKEESDDSMASDASSRPSDKHTNDKANRGIKGSKHSKLDHVKKLFSCKKTNEKEKHKKYSK